MPNLILFLVIIDYYYYITLQIKYILWGIDIVCGFSLDSKTFNAKQSQKNIFDSCY